MKTNDTSGPADLDQIDPKRRGFLAKMLSGGVALPLMTSVTLGAEPQKGGKGKGGKGKGGKGKGGKGKGGERGTPNTGDLAARLIREFDRDGDQALNARELEAALTALRSQMRRGRSGQDSGMPGKGKGKGADGKGKGKGKGKGDGSIGGEGVNPNPPGNQ